jgi:mannose-1-phosphate guanylyltransferase
MAKNRYIVIMAGGKGERFWPQSRQKMPKQLLPIVGDASLLEQTIKRLGDLVPAENIYVITNADYADAVANACPMLDKANIVAEPVGRDTAAAVGLAAILVRRQDKNASFAVLPSDHAIHDAEGFRNVLANAFEVAESEDALVTIGIQPEFPATGYGYINRGPECMRLGDFPVYKVNKFVEKPNLELAKQYVTSGQYYWNAGMFIWSAASLWKALGKHAPELHAGLVGMEEALNAGQPLSKVLANCYEGLKKISIDYALMEKADNVLTVPGLFDWDDVGSWPSLFKHLPHDASGNVIRGDAVVLDGSDNIVVASDGHLVSVMGISNCIVVHTKDVTMVCPKDRAQDIRKLVAEVSRNPDWSNRV